jgi:malate dehydrogenase (oxaloacetate-decarboxylating)
MKLAAAHAIASLISDAELHPEYVIPSVFDKRVADAVSRHVEDAAYTSGVARRERASTDAAD